MRVSHQITLQLEVKGMERVNRTLVLVIYVQAKFYGKKIRRKLLNFNFNIFGFSRK